MRKSGGGTCKQPTQTESNHLETRDTHLQQENGLEGGCREGGGEGESESKIESKIESKSKRE